MTTRITKHVLYNSSSYVSKYAERFFDWRYNHNGRYAVEDGRYVNCRCWYENEKDGLRARTNPECIIHKDEPE